jgi:hypothetical protein
MTDNVIGSKHYDYGTLVWRDNEAKIAGWESLDGRFHKRWYYPFDSFHDTWAGS